MHFTTALCISLASLLPHALSQKVVGCGVDGFSDANINDCRAAIGMIDTTLTSGTDPSLCIRTEAPEVVSQWCILAESGDCKIGALTTVPTQGGTPMGTHLSGQEVVDYANNVVNGCGAPNGMVNGQGLDGLTGIGVASEF